MIEGLTQQKTIESDVIGPLQMALGRPLLAVSYWLLSSDRELFSVGQLNALGVLFVSLHFDKFTLEISPGWEKSLRGSNLAYHIQAIPAGEPGSIKTLNATSLYEVKDAGTFLWQDALGTRLTCIEVIGLQDSPQAIRLVFPSAEVVIAIGYAGDELLVGDGDDLLIFSKREWQHQKSSYGGEWKSLWTTSATRQSGLAVK